MSLIEKALERAQQMPYTAAAEREPVPAPVIPPPAPVPSAPIAAKERIREDAELEAFEKKVRVLEASSAPKVLPPETKKGLKGFLLIFCVAAVFAGLAGIYVWTRSYQPEVSSRPEPMMAAPSILRPSILGSAPAVKISLTGITSSGGVRYALINNQVVTIGDMLKKENAVVKDIHDRSAILEQNGRTITLTLDSNA